jgi:DNA-binding response OmpR family regulator
MLLFELLSITTHQRVLIKGSEVMLPMRVSVIGGDLPTRHLTTLQNSGMQVATGDFFTDSTNCILLFGADAVSRVTALRANSDTPIICCDLLSSQDRASAINRGADDACCLKTISATELIARLNAINRRTNRDQKVEEPLWLGTDDKLHFGEEAVKLTGKEAELFKLLSSRQGMWTKEAILTNLYRSPDTPEIKIVDIFVCKLRRKLTGLGCPPDTIATVWGRGYQFHMPEPASTECAA